MKRWSQHCICASIFLIFHTSFFIPNTVHAQHWWTGWSQQTGLALCLHQTDSTYELYSPLQTSDPIPVTQWFLRGDTLRLECASIGFKTTLVKRDSLWAGTWWQGILKESITFRPADTLYRLRRPQTPQPPYHFDEETVTADYTDSQGNAVHLEGTLSVPRLPSPPPGRGALQGGVGEKYPCLLLVSGSGQQNRDEEILFHKPFLVLADYLSSRGIAVLRYDDRGVGASTGPLDSTDTRLFSEDAEVLFNVLKTNSHIDPDRLGIGGHSEGGAIAPMVAARNRDVKFVVMLAGQGCTGLEVLAQQNEALFHAKGVSDSLVAIRTACMREIFLSAVATRPAASPLTVKDYQALIAKHTSNLTKEQIDSIDLKKGTAYALKQQLDSRWMRTFLSLDPAEYLPKVQCPILALQGEKDCQVVALPNSTGITRLAGDNVNHQLFIGLNHLFQHCQTGSPDEYVQIEETFAPEVMKALADWILALQ